MTYRESHHWSRYLLSSAMAFGTTVGLFFLMQLLIEGEDEVVLVAPPKTVVDWRIVEDLPPPPPRKPRPPKLEPVPAPPPVKLTVGPEPIGKTTSELLPVEPPGQSDDPKPVADGNELPLVAVAPEYPRVALTRGIEGYVVLEFTVDASGAVRDPYVLHAQPAGIFDKAALRAVKRYKYTPRRVGGRAVPVYGKRYRMRFSLESGTG